MSDNFNNKCSVCNKEMKKGYIQSGTKLAWVPKVSKLSVEPSFNKECISQVKSEPLRNSILNHPKIKSYSLFDSFFNHSSVSRIRKDGPFIFKTCDLCVNRSVNAAVNTWS